MSVLLRSSSGLPTLQCVRQSPLSAQASRAFSSTNPMYKKKKKAKKATRARQQLFTWLRGPGQEFLDPKKRDVNYLGGYNNEGKLRRLVEVREEFDTRSSKLQDALERDPENKELQIELIKTETARKDLGVPKAKPASDDMVVFPTNPAFKSQPVLGFVIKNEIYNDIKSGKTIRETSVKYGIEMGRVAAVYRLQEVERDWRSQGKEIAYEYAKTVMEMLPQTERPDNDKLKWMERKKAKEAKEAEVARLNREAFEAEERASGVVRSEEEIEAEGRKRAEENAEKLARAEAEKGAPHETINDLVLHPATGQQIFLPTSESRVFTRTDAAKAFSDHLLPADKRVPHPELAQIQREKLNGLTDFEIEENAKRRAEADIRNEVALRRKLKETEAKTVKKVIKNNVVFRFENIEVEAAGKDGRGINGVGARYGIPSMDRSKGHMKIPIRIDRPAHQRQIDYGQ